MTDYLNAVRLFNRNVKLFFAASALHGLAFFGIYALIFNLYIIRLGYGPEFIGLVNAAGPLALAVASLPAGAISRRLGSRRALIIGYLMVMVGLGMTPLAELLPGEIEAAWLLAGYMTAWLFGSLIVVNFAPFLMGCTTEVERDHAFAIWSASLPVAGFVGSLIGGLLPVFYASLLDVSLDNPAPYRLSLITAALLYAPAALAIWLTRGVSLDGTVETQSDREAKSAAPYAIIFVIGSVWLMRTAGEWSMRVFFNVYLDTVLQVSPAAIGALMAGAQLLGIIALAAPLLMARWGKERTIIWGTLGMAAVLLPMAFIAHWAVAGLALMGMIGLVSITGPAMNVYSQELVRPEWRTTLSGATSMSLGVGIALMAFGGGYLIVASGYTALFLVAAAVTASGALIFWAYFRKPRGELA